MTGGCGWGRSLVVRWRERERPRVGRGSGAGGSHILARVRAGGKGDARAGFTLLELVIVVTITGVLLAIAVPRAREQLDRLAVAAAAGDVVATLHTARSIAIGVPGPVAVHVDTVAGILSVRRGRETFLTRGIAAAHEVRLAASRDSLAFDARGLGRGAANLSIVVRRGAVAETVFVARLGRIRSGG